jgi:hypothetical protein
MNNFYYYDEQFSLLDWSKEPSESLEQLYKERAQQIRDTYEYVVLCYSGGIDSTTVLETFYYNNIHIDEILVVGALSQDSYSGSDENHNGDLYYNVFPTLNSFNLPNTKVTVYDYTTLFRDPNNFTLIKKYGPCFIKNLGYKNSVHNLFWYDLDKFVISEKKTAYVFGKEKPLLFKDDIGYYTNFTTTGFTDYGNRYDYSNGRRVNFYTEPNASKILLKQLYMLKAQNIYFESSYDEYVEKVKKVIYNLKNPLKFTSYKSKINFLSERDRFMMKNKNSDIFKIYAEGINLIKYNYKQPVEISKCYYLS